MDEVVAEGDDVLIIVSIVGGNVKQIIIFNMIYKLRITELNII